MAHDTKTYPFGTADVIIPAPIIPYGKNAVPIHLPELKTNFIGPSVAHRVHDGFTSNLVNVRGCPTVVQIIGKSGVI